MIEESSKQKILILVKTYPTLSTKNIETVCTAGMREDGSWVRIYPITYRRMDKSQRFRKYQWIEANLARNTSDPRLESYKLAGDIKPLRILDTRDGWKNRKNIVLKNVYTDLAMLINEARDKNVSTSLAAFKPARIIGFSVSKFPTKLENIQKQKALEEQLDKKQARKLAEQVPYKFYYTFVDENGKRSRMQILDWEIYQLCRKIIRKYGYKKDVVYRHLREKYFDELAKERDVYLFLGTTKYWHIRRSSNPFMIIGVFYPPKTYPIGRK